MRVQVSRAIQTFRVIAVRAIRVLVAILALVELPIVLLGQGRAYNAGDFTAADSMTWTIDEADVTTFRYKIMGKLMYLNFFATTSARV